MLLNGGKKNTDNQPGAKRTEFKQREIERMLEGINDEIAIITASAKFNFTLEKTRYIKLA